MTIQEAIKILTEDFPSAAHCSWAEYVEARKLGIEALKSRQEHRHINNHPDQELLPGETKE